MITFVVFGKAAPAGSKRGFVIRNKSGAIVTRKNGSPVVAITDANPNSREWKNLVTDCARQNYRGDLLRGPLRLTLKFFRPRPKGHIGSKGHTKAGRAMPHPTSKPDVTKLVRGVEDALTGIVWADDAQIVDQHASKQWGEPARCEITIEELTPSAVNGAPAAGYPF